MKTRNFKKPLLAAIAGLALLAGNVVAQDASTAAAVQSAPQLSYGVGPVLQLSQAKVSDSTIVAYIHNSGTIYALDANQIVYLKQQGVSDTVLNTMLNQRQNVANNAAQTAPTPPASAQTPNAVAQPTVTYSTVPTSSVYVIPDTQTYQYDTYYQPYYYPYYGYYGWAYPGVSLSFGFGGGYRGGFHGGGFRGGWHR
ncbi:MAG TPA: hypothetical protein VGH42_07295 [Verrucomicrobiae bacterium]|jgi:hypothetical protein